MPNPSFAFPLSQVEVADHLGMTVVHLNRVLRRMEERRILAIRRGRMELLNMGKLQSLSCLYEPSGEETHPLL